MAQKIFVCSTKSITNEVERQGVNTPHEMVQKFNLKLKDIIEREAESGEVLLCVCGAEKNITRIKQVLKGHEVEHQEVTASFILAEA